MNVGQCSSNSVEFIQETLYINNATLTDDHSMSVAEREAGVVSDGEYMGGEKARSDFNFAKINQPVETIAHWVAATRQALSDEPMLMSYVQGRLIYGVKLAEDDQILNGTGVGGQFQGFMTHPGVQVAGAPAGADTVIDHIRRALTLARLAEYPVNAIILNPTDWAAIELVQGANGQYVYGNPNGSEPTTLWRIPVVESTAMDANNFLLGAFDMGASLWDREQATVRISEHHARYFVQNLIAILAEERITMTVYRPQAFVRGTFA
jgi:HK97 family phage major capsid protein